jgi:ABC-type branched-subunit amino acid transport system ATPase component
VQDSRGNGARAALELNGVTKAFGGLVAVADVTLSIAERERRALIGPNGAGKTTLFHLVSGELSVTRGRIRLFGEDVTRLPPNARVGRGLGRTYQITNIFPALSVEDNVMLAAMGLGATKFDLLRPVSRRGHLAERAEQALRAVALQDYARVPARELSHGAQRQLELALALASRPRVLLLDEPAAGVPPEESREVLATLSRLPADVTVLLIEHDMDLVFRFAERISVLMNGALLVDGTPEDVARDPRVRDVYLGEDFHG